MFVSPLYGVKVFEIKSVTVEIEAPCDQVAMLWAQEGRGKAVSFVEKEVHAQIISIQDSARIEEKKEQKDLT